MPLVNRNGIWYMRYQVEGLPVNKSTRLKATEKTRQKAEVLLMKDREALIDERRFNVKRRENKIFSDAADEFQLSLEAEYGGTQNTIEASRAALNHCRHYFK